MNLLNKYELIGIFFSIAVMAVALVIVRFNTDFLAQNDTFDLETQGAVVAVSQTERTKAEELENTLKEASTGDGTLVKLVIDDVRIGEGAEVKKGDSITVHYVGTTQNGIKFDSSYERGKPYTYTVGAGTVIDGWEQGLIGMKVGGQRILVIPAEMAYGNRQVGAIAPNSPLVFSVELLSIN